MKGKTVNTKKNQTNMEQHLIALVFQPVTLTYKASLERSLRSLSVCRTLLK